MKYLLIITLIIVFAFTGCSNGGNQPVSPEPVAKAETGSREVNHFLWGLWQGVIDPDAETLEMVALRVGEFHLNALQFLEPPPLVNLTLESLVFNGNIIEADIGLRHPFLGLNEFTGFDVAGIFITTGSVTGFNDPDLRMAGEGDTRLLNFDGQTRWWNPSEFPVNDGTMFSYKDGLLGTSDAVGHFNSTLNAYKYFCDDLGPNDTLDKVTVERRGLFSAGKKNIRHYTIELGSGLIFNYAVDASWQFPQGGAPWDVPDDFAPAANKPEAWNVTVTELLNTLYNDGAESGGDLSLEIKVWDHFNAGLNNVWLDSSGNFPFMATNTPTGGGAGYSTYQIDIVGATPSQESIDIFIGVESEAVGYQGFIEGKPVTSYFWYTADVSEEPYEVECGEGIHEFDDKYYINGISDWRYCQRTEFTILEAGKYAGDAVVKSSYDPSSATRFRGDFIRFDPDNPSNPVGEYYFSMPGRHVGDTETNYVHFSNQVDQNPVNAHIGVVNGRMFDVVQIVDEDGNPVEDVQVTDPQTPTDYMASITGLDFDADGDMWLVTNVLGDNYDYGQPIWQLRHYELQSSSPYYVENVSDRLDITNDLKNPAAGSAPFGYVTDIAVSYEEDFLFVFAGYSRSIFVKYDISASPPVKLDAVDLLPFGIAICTNSDCSIMSRNDIEIDHVDPKYEKCRVLIAYERWNGEANDVHLMKIDTDFNVLADVIVQTIGDSWMTPHAYSINTDPEKRNVIAIDMHYQIPFNDFFYYTMPADW